jgi:hypothetical protein
MLMPALALVGAAVFMPTRPVSGDATFTVFGNGSDSCGEWTQGRRQGVAAVSESWADGFLSGVNWRRMNAGMSGHLGSDTDQPGLYAWIDNYCQQHPLEKLEGAVQYLVFELNGNQW